jgi:TRAP-type C4-dicarboxylate transport system substrate-binding protein
MKRTLLSLFLVVAFFLAWKALAKIELKVLGQPESTGAYQQKSEAPFFQNLTKTTGLPLDVAYRALNQTGVKDIFQLQLMKEGVFDIVSLRFIQNSKTEPTLEGIDLAMPGIDFAAARAVSDSYFPVVDRRLQEHHRVKLLGVWTFGPQELFCNRPVNKLSDLQGLKVRVAGPQLEQYFSALGAIAAIIPFDDTLEAFKKQLIDCAVTSAASASFARWLDFTSHYIPLSFGFGINGYVISLDKWNQFTATEQATLSAAFAQQIQRSWVFAKENYSESVRCMTGDLLCQEGFRRQMVRVAFAQEDVTAMRRIALSSSIADWFKACSKLYSTCEQEWLETIGATLKLN